MEMMTSVFRIKGTNGFYSEPRLLLRCINLRTWDVNRRGGKIYDK